MAAPDRAGRIRRSPVTAAVVATFLAVYALELWVRARHGLVAYVDVFFATPRPSPGWLLAPLAHSLADPTHLLSSVLAVAVFGSFLEARLAGRAYAALFVGGAYLSTAAQVVVDAAGPPTATLGASGGAMALAAFASVWVAMRAVDPDSGVEGFEFAVGGVATGLVVLQYAVDAGTFGATPANAGVGHLAGAFVGVLAALWAAAG